MEGHGARLPLASLAAVVSAGVATLILRPRSSLVNPVPLEATAYFSPEQLQRVEEFRGPQRLLGLGGMGLSGATLGLIAARPPRRLLRRVGARPHLGAAATGAGMAVAMAVVGLPIGYAAHRRARRVGLATQTLGPWLGDVGRSTAIGAVFAAGGAAGGLALVRRFPGRWWMPAAGVAVAVGIGSLYVFPLLIDPLFNKFEPLPPGPLRTDVLELAERAGVDVGEVYRIDASRRTTAANAYVSGIGPTKRVVLYDTLIDRFPPAELRWVVAHELAHVRHRDIRRGLAWSALVAPGAAFLAQELAEALRGDGGLGTAPGPEAIPALAVALALVSFALGPVSNALARGVERSADAFALALTEDPQALVAVQRRLAIDNLADPDPPAVLQALFGTHPTTLERIGVGVAYEGAASPAPPRTPAGS